MKTVIHSIAAIAITATLFTSCKPEDNAGPCDGANCTALFAMIPVTITDSTGGSINFDRVFAYPTDNKKDTIKSFKSDGISNVYIIVDDNYLENMRNSTRTIRFVGMKNGTAIVDEPYTISADCCHIKRESGKETIIVK
jgi:hypothetical protein